MKKRIIFLTAVLLFAVLLVFLKEKGIFRKEAEPSATPTPEVTKEQVLKNVWIITSDEESITFFCEGKEQTYATKGKLQETLTSCIADMTVKGETVLSLVVKPDKVTAKVLRTDGERIELEGYGELAFTADFKLYRLYDGPAEEPSGRILVGSSGNEFILENGRVCAALIKEKPELKKIRVLIGTEGFLGYYHQKVEVTSDCAYTVTYGEKKESFQAGEVCSFTRESFAEESGRRLIVPEKADGKITLCSIKRSEGIPSYRGTLEIAGVSEGLLVVNEVTIEEYLYAVIPSEMPTTFGKEALKAQAICARSYAYTELLANRYAQYGAHVDDSVACQVYNNIGENETSILAVKDTHGQVLLYGGEVAQCYYFSTSSGHTTSVADVWENAKELPYLQGKLHAKKADEEAAEALQLNGKEADDASMKLFLTSTTETYDSESAWYRWQTFLPLKALEQTIQSALKSRYAAVPEQILTYDEAGDAFVNKPIGDIGKLYGIQIYGRGNGGIVTELLVVAEKGVFLVKNEYNIRTVLAPVRELIYRQNGENINGAALLPSAFVTLQKGIYQDETGYLVTGGGYGHGVGMSQCGADAMARCGFTCEEIMEEYYPGTTIGFIYD
ncbi:MAG: SpoIID/LytB domain-containing protein [Lachnospiraceae bacterium]|nr:SpoIID/LytB domain-containing protein [Lachnospiraceae bacterium]